MKEQPEEKMAVDAKVPIVAEDVTEEDMMAMMGFSGFSSTKVSLCLTIPLLRNTE